MSKYPFGINQRIYAGEETSPTHPAKLQTKKWSSWLVLHGSDTKVEALGPLNINHIRPPTSSWWKFHFMRAGARQNLYNWKIIPWKPSTFECFMSPTDISYISEGASWGILTYTKDSHQPSSSTSERLRRVLSFSSCVAIFLWLLALVCLFFTSPLVSRFRRGSFRLKC